MSRFVWSRDWRVFFGDEPYPFDLAMVEARDGADEAARLIAGVVGTGPKRVIDLGCGYGRHLHALTHYGYQVFGSDICRTAATRAAHRLPARTTVVAENGRLPFRHAVFDAAVCLYTSLGYPGMGTRAILAEAARVVRPGGVLVVDVANGASRRTRVGWERVPGGFALWLRYAARGETRQRNVVASRRVTGLYGFTHRRYSAPALVARVAGDGLWSVHKVLGDFTGAPCTPDGSRIVVVACRTRL